MTTQKAMYEVSSKEFFENYGNAVATSEDLLREFFVPEFTDKFPEHFVEEFGKLLDEDKFDEVVGGAIRYLTKFMKPGDEPIRFYWTRAVTVNETETRGFILNAYPDMAIASDGERNWVYNLGNKTLVIKDAEVSRALADKNSEGVPSEEEVAEQESSAQPVPKQEPETVPGLDKIKDAQEKLKEAGFDLSAFAALIPVIAPMIKEVLAEVAVQVIKEQSPKVTVQAEEVVPEPVQEQKPVVVKEPEPKKSGRTGVKGDVPTKKAAVAANKK